MAAETSKVINGLTEWHNLQPRQRILVSETTEHKKIVILTGLTLCRGVSPQVFYNSALVWSHFECEIL